MKAINRQPVVFIGHGSPMNTIEDNEFTRVWKQLGKTLQPKAILVISAHWVSHQFEVTSKKQKGLLYDMFGFPDELYQVEYPVEIDSTLVKRIQELVNVSENDTRKLDHGVYSVCLPMFPEANIPLVQLSLNGYASVEEHYELGEKLSVLREEGVLILGSGNIVHNLREVDWHTKGGYEWAEKFHNHINTYLVNREDERCVHYEDEGRAGLLSVNTKEHYLPMIVCLGASNHDTITLENDTLLMGSLSMTCCIWRDKDE